MNTRTIAIHPCAGRPVKAGEDVWLWTGTSRAFRPKTGTGPAVDPVCIEGALPRRAKRVSA